MCRAAEAKAVVRARPVDRSGHPLGPLVYHLPAEKPRVARVWAAAVLASCLGVLALAAILKPDPKGFGTHSQLGLPECGMVQTLGIPCPTCGMTTAFVYTVRGHWIKAFDTQPAGWVLCLATIATTGLALSVLITGRSWRLNWYRATPARVTALVVGLLLGAWAYKIVRVLMDGGVPAAW